MARSSFSVPSSAVLVPPFLSIPSQVVSSQGIRVGRVPDRGSMFSPLAAAEARVFLPYRLRLLRGTNLIRK
jgi:hypothetical protein